jgi:hypothetical protein
MQYNTQLVQQEKGWDKCLVKEDVYHELLKEKNCLIFGLTLRSITHEHPKKIQIVWAF